MALQDERSVRRRLVRLGAALAVLVVAGAVAVFAFCACKSVR
jgi:hypothetical protein